VLPSFVVRAVAVALLVVAGCGGKYPKTSGGGAGTGDDGLPRGVEAAALPYSVVDGKTGKAVADADFWAALGAAKVVCVGEDHSNPHHHWAQLEIVDKLSAQRKAGLGLGMEMVQRPFQAVLDDYRAARIDEAALLSRTGWGDRWSFDFALYRPVIRMAVDRGAALVALNAARELTKKVVRQGLDALSAEERAGIAKDLVLDDAQHRAWFDEVMSGFGGAGAHGQHGETPPEEVPPDDEVHAHVQPAPSADAVYTVQVIWDETMAEGAAGWVAGGDRAMVVLAGNGHCHDSEIVGRVARRGVTPAVSVRPMIDDGQGNVAVAIQEARNDYLFVMTMPR
jgi:uncharacterized iron-regulated protein